MIGFLLIDIIIAIIVLFVFFGIGRNIKRTRELLEKKNQLYFRKYAYKSKFKDEYSKEYFYIFDEGYISDKEIIGELEDETPIIKHP